MKYVYGLFILCLLLPGRLLAQYNQVPDNVELAALEQLYYDTNGGGWTSQQANQQPWLQGQTIAAVAQWYGVTVANGDVTGLRLSSNNLTGNLPGAIGQLTALQTLDLSNNYLADNLPSELGNLVELQTLKLSHNQFTQQLPSTLNNLPQLLTFDVSYNDLMGKLPALTASAQLSWVDVSHNQLKDNLDLPTLTSSADLGYLDLSFNLLTGKLSGDVGNFSALQLISVEHNMLEGELPRELGNLPLLFYFDASSNSITGNIPDAIGTATALTYLYLSHNKLNGPVPYAVWKLGALKQLELNDNSLSDQLPTGIEQLANLTYLDISSNELTGPLPDGMGQLSSLVYLDASNNQLQDVIDNRLAYLSNLFYLSLANNQFTGTLPANVGYSGQWNGLNYLNLSGNQLTGNLPGSLGSISGLYYLDLAANQFTGNLPAELGSLTALTYLYLDHNQFAGPVPLALQNLQQIQELNLAANQLAGSLPTGSQWLSLAYAKFDENQFSGAVPTSLLALPALQYLGLSHNHFTSLPPFSYNASLASLRVEANHLTFGDLESYFTGPGAVRYADFGYTDQTLPADEHILSVTTGLPWSLPSAIGGSRSRYQWQYAPLSGGWQTLTAAAATYQRSAAVAGDAGRYRCTVVNDWVVGVTLYSPVTTVRVQQALPPDNPSNDYNLNWTLERTYDGNGETTANIISESKQFTDGLGRETQAQARNAATQQTFAEQTIYNSGGQAVLKTLAAPTNNQSFAYKAGFVTTGGQAYDYTSFEGSYANAPKAVDNTTLGTLGYYFSKQNTLEPLTPVTSYPYSLSEPNAGPLGGTKRTAAPGDELRMGKGREVKGREFLVRQEFDHYLTLRPQFVPGSTATTLEYQAVKAVSVDADGREGFVVSNKEGQALISGLSGPQYTALPIAGYVTAELPPAADPNAGGYVDIHVPAAGNQLVVFTPNGATVGTLRISDLLTDASYDYPITSASSVTPAAGSYAYSTSATQTQVTLPPGFYRFTSLSGTQRYAYEAHYGNLSYTYYDEAGRGVATVAPNGLAGGNLLRNAGFEQDQTGTASPSAWQTGTGTTPGAAYTETQVGSPAHGGSFYGCHWQPGGVWGAYTYQVVSGLPDGYYTLRAWVENTNNDTGGAINASMQVQNYGGGLIQVTLPSMFSWEGWQQITLPNIHVTNGQCEIGFASSANSSYGRAWIRFDDVELVRQADASAPTFVTRNTYDTSGRLLATESADEGRSEYVYAQDGRIRFSQSALQRVDGRYSYSNYDEIGRVVESGEYVPGYYATHVFENHLTATPATNSVLAPSILESRTRSGGLYPGWFTQRNQVWYDLPFDGSDGSQGNDAQLAGRQQQILTGSVAKTKNGNVTSWYSYDELGRVTWVVQDIAGVGVKTLDYRYDFSGNVLQVAYQQDQPDRFYHYYAYDAAQRLSTVHTSPDGVNRTLQAEYTYYLHGPLKRVQLASNLQGVDYTYTLQGTLKNLNHVNPSLEPGHDSPRTTGVYKDLFALTLDYFNGDYASRDLDVAAPAGSNVPTRYDGTIQGAAWRTAASADVQRVVYRYDEKSQLQNSTFGKVSTAGTATQFTPSLLGALQEGGLTYDLNGNIQSLRRTNQTGAVTDNFSYSYTPNTNRLKEVHTGSASGATVLSYDYNEIGQTTRQTDEQGARYFTYDVTGKTTGVYYDQAHQQPAVTFAYDDRGFRVRKTVYQRVYGPPVTTYYVRDVAGNLLANYEQVSTDPVQRTEVPLYGSGRLGVLTHVADGTASGTDDYRYELTDHLGDARVVFHRPTKTTDVETMEPNVQARAAFLNNSLYRAYRAGAPSPNYVARLTGTQLPNQALKRTITVLQGDTITFSALGLIENVDVARTGTPAHRVQPYLLLGAAAPASDQMASSEAGQPTSAGPGKWLGRLAAGLSFTLGGHQAGKAIGDGQASRQLQAWLRYQLLDSQGNPVGNPGYAYLSSGGGWESVSLGFRVPQNGSLELTAGTSSGSDAVAYFDNLTVEQTSGLIIQEQHQYALGAPLPGLTYIVGGVKKYRYSYQGQFAEHDSETGLESFELRMYSSRVGKWLSTDPEEQFDSPYVGMGNNPVSNIDPNGGNSVGGILFMTAFGAGIGGTIAAGATLDGDNFWKGAVIGALAGYFIGGGKLPKLSGADWETMGELSSPLSRVTTPLGKHWWCAYACLESASDFFVRIHKTSVKIPQKDWAKYNGNNASHPDVGVKTKVRDLPSWIAKGFQTGITYKADALALSPDTNAQRMADELNKNHPILFDLKGFAQEDGRGADADHMILADQIQRQLLKNGHYRYRIRTMDPTNGGSYNGYQPYGRVMNRTIFRSYTPLIQPVK